MMRTKPPTNSQRMEGSSQLADPGERHSMHEIINIMCTGLTNTENINDIIADTEHV